VTHLAYTHPVYRSNRPASPPKRTRGVIVAACACLGVLAFALRVKAQSKAAVELHVAAAADLQPVFPALAEAYEHTSGVHLVASFGSSATLTQQIENGAPQDVFLSADTAHPAGLVAKGLAASPQPVEYAHGVLVLWARRDSPVQPLGPDVAADLRSGKLQRLAVANDLHAPYGAAATAAIRSMGLTDTLKPKLVIGENILQTAQFADTGNAQAGLISATIAHSAHFRETGTAVQVPDVYPPIRQAGVALRSARNPAAAQAFLAWLESRAGQDVIARLGLEPAK
jgi:molybdate transport system substrate-binding protein